MKGLILRNILASLAALVLTASVAVAAPAHESQVPMNWDGTWIGNWGAGDGQGTQIVFVGNEVIAFYWRGDYVGGLHSSATRDGKKVTLTWPGGEAVLTGDTTAGAHIAIREKGHAEIDFALSRDH